MGKHSVTVVIINRDLVTWPKAMVERIERFSGLAEIILLDNASTYPPLLDWYGRVPHTVIREKNLGHTGPWMPHINERIRTDLYVVSDPDLGLEGVPEDCLEHLAERLDRFPKFGKIGLALDVECVPAESIYFHHVQSHERRYWELPLIDGELRAAAVDTTFAIYRKSRMNAYQVCGARCDRPYVAKHLPWSIVERSAEFDYYLRHASSSSSYKSFTGLKGWARRVARRIGLRE